MFHLPPFHSVKRSSWGKASLNTGECFPGDIGPEQASSNTFSQQEIHWVKEWLEFLGNQVFSSRVLYHESYLWSLWARQVSESHRNCLSIIDFWCCCLPRRRIPPLFFFSLFLSHPIVQSLGLKIPKQTTRVTLSTSGYLEYKQHVCGYFKGHSLSTPKVTADPWWD